MSHDALRPAEELACLPRCPAPRAVARLSRYPSPRAPWRACATGGRAARRASGAYHVAVDIGLLLVIILIAVFVWRGPKTLPELGKMFGEGVRAVRREARHAANDEHDEPGASSTPGGH